MVITAVLQKRGAFMALIELKDVCKIYNQNGRNEVYALDHISLSIEKGEYVAVVGQSGSGKSTLMNTIGCLDVPTSGQYLLEGEDVSTFSDRKLSVLRNHTIGFIFQGFNLIPSLNAVENVELPLMYRGVPGKERKRIAVASLDKVGLGNRMFHRPSQMSGGQQQRVAIARAVAANPSLILADEPTGNLDSKSGRDVMDILNELNSEGNTIILITHDSRIADMAKRKIQIHDGKIKED